MKKRMMKYKIRFLFLSFTLTFLFFFSLFLLKPITSAKFRSGTNISLDVDYAVFLFQEELFSFQMNTEGIVPREEPYYYTFSVSNYDNKKMSDVDLSYSLQIRTTTNLPITYELYKNESPGEDAINLLKNCNTIQDEDGSWYYEFSKTEETLFSYKVQSKDVYILAIKFPLAYSFSDAYADSLDLVEFTIEAKQVIGEV